MKRITLLALLTSLSFLLAACLPAATPSPTPIPTPEPTAAPSPLPPAWQPAANAAAADLALKLGLTAQQVAFVSAEAHEWPDSCLGLGGPAEMCAAVITPGYLITLQAGGKTYLYRASQDGSALRLVPDQAPEEGYPPAVEAARRDAAVQAGIPPAQVTVVSYEPATWSDSCLGVHAPNAMCLQVLVPGYRVIVDAGGARTEYHTDESGASLVAAAVENPTIVRQVIHWKQEGENCLEARVSMDGLISAGACGGMQTIQPLSSDQQARLDSWVNSLGGFEASRGAQQLSFSGAGSAAASDVLQRSILEWTRAAALSASGSEGAHAGLAFTWQRSGGIAGFCDGLMVYLSGEYAATSCKGKFQSSGLMYLPEEKLAALYAWVDRLAPFEIDHTDPAEADAMTVKLSFYGQGASPASQSDQAAIQAFASEQAFYALAEPQAADLAAAEKSLRDFFSALNAGDYAAAAALYGGSFASLVAMNPDIEPANRPALLEAGCTRNGLVCLQVRDIPGSSASNREHIVFTVEFSTPQGQLFVRGPCCGSTEAEMPSVSQFDYSVRWMGGKYKVMDLPVYVP